MTINEKRKTHYERMRAKVLARTQEVRRPRQSQAQARLIERSATATALLQLLEFTVARETSAFAKTNADIPPELESLVEVLHDYRKAIEETFK